MATAVEVRRTRVVLAGAALAVLMIAGGGAWWALRSPVAVTAVAAARGDVVGRVVASGQVQPAREDDISTRVAGIIVEFDLKEGDRVKEGQVLARLQTTPLQAALADARSRLAAQQSLLAQAERKARLAGDQADVRLRAAQEKLTLAQSQLTDRETAAQRALAEAQNGLLQAQLQLKRLPSSELLQAQVDHAQNLLQSARDDLDRLAGPDHPARLQVALAQTDLDAARADAAAMGVLPEELQALRAAVDAADQAVRKAQEDLDSAVIKAPYDGTVLKVQVKKGAGVAAGAPLLTLATLDRAKVAANVDEADVDRVAPGQPATITSPAVDDLRVSGKVTRVMPRAGKDAANATVIQAEVEFKNEGLRLRQGMNADVSIETARRTGVLRLPRTAVRGTGQDRFVWVVENGRARQRSVTLGVRDPAWAEVTAGLEEGDRVITGPDSVVRSLRDGQPVEVKGE